MKNEFNEPLLPTLPNLVGDIARYVDNSLEVSSPEISIACAMSFVSALKSNRVETIEGISPSLYCCVIASSGRGKSQAQRAISDLILACNMQKMLMGKPASDSGLLKALQDNPRRFLIWDEFGIALSELSKATSSHRALILSTLMDLFSSSGKLYIGKQYAKDERIDIKAPYLSILAASTPNRFFGALSEEFVLDGFLSRWLLFFTDETQSKRVLFDESETIIERILEIENPIPVNITGNIAKILNANGRKFISFHDSIFTFKESFKQEYYESKNEIQKIFWTRAYEQFIKICIVLCDDKFCDLKLTLLAFKITEDLIKGAIAQAENCLFANERERTKERFRNCIKPGEKITPSILARRSYRLNLSRNERNMLIEDLIEAGFWQRITENGVGHKKISYLQAL